jgi:hypothetical protein
MTTAEKIDRYTRYFGLFCKECLKIKTESGDVQGIQPLKLNRTQETIAAYLLKCEREKKPIRLIVLKARREGVSTVVAAFNFWKTALGFNTNCYVISHTDEGVSYLFDIYKLFYDMLDSDLRPQKRHDNAKILRFENPNDTERLTNPGRRCEIRVGSAESGKIGSGYTTHLLHFSEVAKSKDPETIMNSLKPSVPMNGAIIYESTAFGAGNYFHREWKRAKEGGSDFYPMFFPWFDHESYKMKVPDGFMVSEKEADMMQRYGVDTEQIAWRRWAIANICDGDEAIFQQEFPATDEEAFLVSGRGVFKPSILEWYRKEAPGDPKWVGDVDIMTSRDGKEVASLSKRTDGRLRIWEGPDRLGQNEYVFGADVAEGIDLGNRTGSTVGDRSSIHILERKTGRMVAKWVGWMDPDHFGKIICALGLFYNKAILGVEANNYGILVLTTIRDSGYDVNRIYHSQRWGEDYDEDTLKMGWVTSGRTKPMLIGDLIAAMRDRQIRGIDLDTLDELRTYVKDARGKMYGEKGCWDDQVISLAIAWQMILCTIEANIKLFPTPKAIREFNTARLTLNSGYKI